MERSIKGVIDLSWLLQETQQSTKKKIRLLIESKTSNFRCQAQVVFLVDKERETLMPRLATEDKPL